jgi:hypothetical protein
LLVGGSDPRPSRKVESPIGKSGYATLRLELDGPSLLIDLEFDAARIHDDETALDAIPGRLRRNADRLDGLKKERASAKQDEIAGIDKKVGEAEEKGKGIEEDRKRLESFRSELKRITEARKADLSFTVVLKPDDTRYIEFAQFGKYADPGNNP